MGLIKRMWLYKTREGASPMNAHLIRQKFLEYFKKNGHEVVASSPVIPAQDPTLLFTNAGMNQFKDCFLGAEKRSYVRATSSQKCVRAGGKHNDLENVGFTARHLTFFEMLGNFSFGDYFKRDAIKFAWEFLTKEVGIAPEKLYATVYEKDDEAYELWHEVTGIPYERISRLGEADNFWAMGDTGPCGPCTEIYVDRGPEYGTGPENQAPGGSGDRFIEIWNLVFMQYNRQADGTLEPLKQTGVDTGMGLERLAVILQNKKTVFHTDLFDVIHRETAKLTGIDYATATADQQACFHVMSDHIRSCSFIIADGCSPSNEGRGYVLRKIIRRAALFAQKLSNDEGLFYKLATAFIEYMSPVYPELKKNETLIKTVLKSEVEKFAASLVTGRNIFERYAEETTKKGGKILDGEHVFKLYDTYGFPPELTKVMAYDRSMTIDMDGFEKEMEKQQALSGKKTFSQAGTLDIPENLKTTFVGYTELESTSPVIWTQENNDGTAWIAAEVSPFYVESGGQVNDQGFVTTASGIDLPVVDLKKVGNPYERFVIAARCTLPTGKTVADLGIDVGATALCTVNPQARASTVKNHTATHMLQAALVTVLGAQIKQAGSVVEPDYLRFDFTHHEGMTRQQIEQVEALINQKIQEDIPTEIMNTSLDKAQKAGVIAFFGEKYNPDNVRVVKIPGFSAELCGGTHAPRTGIIGMFKILSETALATGTRRIVAVTGPEALRVFQQSYATVKALSEHFKAKPEEVVSAVKKQVEQQLKTLSEVKHLKKQLIKLQVPTWAAAIAHVGKVPFVCIELEDAAPDDIKMITQELEKKQPGMYAIINKGERIQYAAYVSAAWVPQVNLKALSAHLAAECGVKGGGAGQSIQGSGIVEVEKLRNSIISWVRAL